MKRLGLLFAFLCRFALGAPNWEVAVIFLGAEEQDEQVLRDMDRNIVELAVSRPNERYRLSLYREFEDRAVAYYVDPHSKKDFVWDPLFFKPEKRGIRVPGQMVEEKVERTSLFYDDKRLARFLTGSYTDPNSRRLLILYTHGLAFEGIRGVLLRDLQSQLKSFLPQRANRPPLDILWFSSCFMSTIEVAYELKDLSTFFMASEDAEYTAGAPFQTLQLLGEKDVAPERGAIELAESYLESYSIKKGGSQSKNVLLSAATISVIETAKLKLLVDALSYIANSLKPMTDEEKQTLRKSRKRIAIQMEKLSLMIDLGSFLRYVKNRKDRFPGEEAQARLDSLLYLLELDTPARVKTNPRLALIPPVTDSRVVYGYQNWTKGDKDDDDTLIRLPKELKFDAFVAGPRSRQWPSRGVHSRLYVSPFSLGLDSFHYFFVSSDPSRERLTPDLQFVRTEQDFATFEAKVIGNPIRFSGYTQKSGATAEKYTGLSVLDPTQEDVAPSYSYTRFSKATLWEDLLR